LAALGWTFTILLLCIVILITIWIRHHVVTKHGPWYISNKQEDMRENSAYIAIPLRYHAETQRPDAVEYAEVGNVICNPKPDQPEYEQPRQ
jgi:hypothetical protein